jgi:hypothetical protein
MLRIEYEQQKNSKFENVSLLVSRRFHPGTPYRTVDRTHAQRTIDNAGKRAMGNRMSIDGNRMDAHLKNRT